MFDKFEQLVYRGLDSSFQKSFAIIGTLVVLVLSVMMIPSELVLAKMLPGKNNNTFNVYIDLPTGSSISQTRVVAECVVEELKKEREVMDIETFLGMGSPLDFAGLIKGSHFKNHEYTSEVVVNLSNKHHRKEPSYLMVQRLRPVIVDKCQDIFPNTSIKFVEPPAGPPTMAAVVAEIYGNSAEGIRELAGRVKGVFAETSGLVDLDIMQDEIYEKVAISVNTVKIARSGLSIKQVNDVLYLALEGMSIAVKNSTKYDDQIPIFLTLQTEDKIFKSSSERDIELKLSSLKLMNVRGMMVPLTEVVEIHKVKSNPMIVSKNLHEMTSVVAETDMVSQVYPLLDARQNIIDNFGDRYDIEEVGLFNLNLTDKTTGEFYELKWDGEMKVTIDTFIDLGGAFIAAMVLIFLLMVIYYRSFKLSGIVLFGSFLSIIGVIVGHYIMDIFTQDTFFLTATSLIGFIALIGISSRNSLLLIDFTKALMYENGMEKRAAIAYATATRAKPIFLTAVAIILASTLLASDAVFGGLGVSLIFGTVSAVVASLVVVPIMINRVKL
jgi:multidrug efflux pump subunit AcrB